MQQNGINYLDSTAQSIEEISAKIMQEISHRNEETQNKVGN